MGAPRSWVYTLKVRGRWQQVHRRVGIVLLAILFVVPWIPVGGHPAVHLDLGARRVYALGGVFSAQDTIYLVILGLGAALSLFLFTSLFGRLWCGYACPQTVFLEEWIRPVEHWLEGDRSARMRRDRGPWTWDRAWRKAAKWSAFALLAVAVAGAFVSWFATPVGFWTGEAGLGAYGLAGAVATALFVDFAWFREQFCNYLCPYARFQGALTDEESLVVAYDEGRGEPRGKARGGDCVDCNRCVAVCPQGIDIRDGFQLECITCGRCVDACADVMGHLRKDNLIAYTALKKPRLLRPRTVAYGTLLAAAATVLVALLATRDQVRANVMRPPGPLYVVDADGWTRNTYLVQVTNERSDREAFGVAVGGLPEGAVVTVPPLDLGSAERATVPLVVRVPPAAGLPRSLPITVRIASHDDLVEVATTFRTEG